MLPEGREQTRKETSSLSVKKSEKRQEKKFVSRFETRARRIRGMIGGAKKLSSFLSLSLCSRGRHGLQGHVDEAQETGQESRSGECTSCMRLRCGISQVSQAQAGILLNGAGGVDSMARPFGLNLSYCHWSHNRNMASRSKSAKLFTYLA